MTKIKWDGVIVNEGGSGSDFLETFSKHVTCELSKSQPCQGQRGLEIVKTVKQEYTESVQDKEILV